MMMMSKNCKKMEIFTVPYFIIIFVLIGMKRDLH